MNQDSARRWEAAGLYVALLAAWVAMMGSLFFSEVRGFIPCTLCWYQRILMYPLAGVIALGILRADRHLPYLVLPFSLVGQGFSTYHYLLQKTTIFSTHTVCSTSVPCTTTWINWFGFVTIPFLAMIGFLVITLCMLVSLFSDTPAPEAEPHRRWPVAAIVVAVVGAYAVGAWSGAGRPASGSTLSLTPAPVAPSSAYTPVEPQGRALSLEEGKQLYLQACAPCHGPEAEGLATLGNALAGSQYLAEHSDADVLAMVRAGRAADAPDNRSGVAMPPSGGRPDLTDDQILGIIEFLRQGL